MPKKCEKMGKFAERKKQSKQIEKIMRIYQLLALLLIPFTVVAEEKVNYMPQIHGVFRGKYEMETEESVSRFQVRNARLSVSGELAPIIDYFIQFDACEKGKMRFLDAWCRMDLSNEFKIQVGQFRKPFGVDAFRNPANQYFANRSFLAKQVGNVRGDGLKLVYQSNKSPLIVEGGVFNAKTVDDQEGFTGGLSFAARALYTLNNTTFVVGWQTMKPEVARLNMIDAAIQWDYERWHVEAEYMAKHYRHLSHPTCHAYNAFAVYKMPAKIGVFNQVSFLGRFDGMTDHSNGIGNDDDFLPVTDVARNRATVGSTFTYKYKDIHADIRLNYEKYFYHSDYTPTEGNRDKIVAELVVKF